MPLLHKTPRMSKNWFWSEMLQVSEGLEKEYKSWAETSWWLKSKHKPWVNIEIRFMVPFFEEIKLQLLLRVIHELEGWGNLPPASWRPFPICTQAAVSSSCFDVCMQVFFTNEPLLSFLRTSSTHTEVDEIKTPQGRIQIIRKWLRNTSKKSEDKVW